MLHFSNRVGCGPSLYTVGGRTRPGDVGKTLAGDLTGA
jgi:hypothetical protein